MPIVSPKMSADHARPIYVAIIGSDTLLAARPADPLQLTQACLVAGFDLVVPVTLGEELIANDLAERLRTSPAGSAVAASCPLALEALRSAPIRSHILGTVSPPVAAARYVRAVLQPRRVHATYVGACPGASDPEIDVHCLPEVLFSKLVESGVDMARQPRHLDGRFPVERARYASLPGGIPEPQWLRTRVDARVAEAAPITVDVVDQLYRDETLLFDISRACRCSCARDRAAIARLEPPRAAKPVIADTLVPVSAPLARDEGRQMPDLSPPQSAPSDARPGYETNGISANASPLDVANRLSTSREPW